MYDSTRTHIKAMKKHLCRPVKKAVAFCRQRWPYKNTILLQEDAAEVASVGIQVPQLTQEEASVEETFAAQETTSIADTFQIKSDDGAQRQQDCVFDIDDEESFVPKTKLAIVEGKLAIFPDVSLAATLQSALLAHRDTRKQEAISDAEAGALRLKFFSLKDEIDALQAEPSEDDDSAASRRQNILALTAQRSAASNRKNELLTSLRVRYETMRDGEIILFDVLEDLLLEPEGHQEDLAAGLDSASSSEIEQSASGQDLEEQEPNDQSTEQDTASHRSSATSTSDAPTQPDTPRSTEEAREQRYVLADLDSAWQELDAAELALENRSDYFASQQRLRAYQASFGRPTWSPTEVGNWEFQKTQSMTQRILRIEARLQEHKADALAIGVQPPGSEISSGFLDRSDDGYLLSNDEEDIVDESDRERIETWLNDIPSDASLFEEMDDVEPDLGMKEPEPDVLDDVAVSDSRSMVAEGSTRRRIDNWKAQAKEIWTSMARA